MWDSKARFNVIEAGRRSGKTELAKRKGWIEALQAPAAIPDFRVVYCAPTRDQAREIYWEDLKALAPEGTVRKISEVLLQIALINNATISVVGLDKPQRMEGKPVDLAFMDEFQDVKESAWRQSIRPALDTKGRLGRAWVYGVPRPNKLFRELARRAMDPQEKSWAYHTWKSAEVLPPEVIEEARRDMDPLLFAQEYEASRVNYSGLAYYGFSREKHCAAELKLNDRKPLVMCFDFNVEPGIAVVVQEHHIEDYPTLRADCPAPVSDVFTACIDEVHIPRDSNTPAVCRRLLQKWGKWKGQVKAYGDSSGGARGTAQTTGTDWDIIRNMLGKHFQGRFEVKIDRKNPAERVRVNAMNGRLESADGTIHMLVDSQRCPMLVEDLEGVILLEGGSGEINKNHDKSLTHLTDALGYYIAREHKIRTPAMVVRSY